MQPGQERSPAAIFGAVADVELTLSCAAALTVAKKNVAKPAIHCDQRVVNGIRRCVAINVIDTHDAYVLINSTDVPPDYTAMTSATRPPTVDYYNGKLGSNRRVITYGQYRETIP